MEESLLDTSELISLRKSGQSVGEAHTTILNLIEYPRAQEFGLVKVLYPTKDDYDAAVVWSVKLLEKGRPVPATDLVIAAVSVRTGLQIITRDQHFKTIKSVAKELKVQVKS